MRTYEERAKDFIAEVYPYIKSCYSYSSMCKAIRAFNHEHHRKVRVVSGSTRIALITSDYVVKMNYDGWGSGTFGNCNDEVRMYRQAVKDGYAHLLAKITPYRKDYNRTFYIMPKITGIEKKPYDADEYVNGHEYLWLYKNIGDRHNGNYGWKDGHIVMIDYAYNSFSGY